MGRFSQTLTALLQQTPDKIWLRLHYPDHDASFTYEQLSRRINDYYAVLERAQIEQGALVLIILKESLDLFASFFAALFYGAYPAYSAYPSDKQSPEMFLQALQGMIQQHDVALLIGYEQVVALLQSQAVDGLKIQQYVSCEAVQQAPERDLSALRQAQDETFLQFSSGTTGYKKGVMITADALWNQMQAYLPYLAYDDTSCVASWLPHYHDMGLIACMLIPVLQGVPIVMTSPFVWVRQPTILLEMIARYRATHVWLPNFALGHLTKRVQSGDNLDLSSLRQLVCCSEPILYDTVTQFLHKFGFAGLHTTQLRACYAMAENTFAVTSTTAGTTFLHVDAHAFAQGRVVPLADAAQSAANKPIASVGRPLSNVQLRVVDVQTGHVAEGVVGEIELLSDCMLSGYYNAPDATTEAFRPDGWFRTGDLGFVYDGELYVTGRRKEVIIIGGENIYPQDVEVILDASTGLAPGRNVAFGVLDDALGTERLVVLAEYATETQEVDRIAIQSAVFQRVGVSVSELILLPPRSLIKSTAGKISRHLNKEAYLAGHYHTTREPQSMQGQQHPLTGPTVAELERLRVIVQRVIHNPSDIHAETPLLSSGLIDSFAFSTLIVELESAYGLSIPQLEWRPENFETLRAMQATLIRLQATSEGASKGASHPGMADEVASQADGIRAARAQSLERLINAQRGSSRQRNRPLEWLINHMPFGVPWLYRILLRAMGVQVGRGVVFRGRLYVKIRGKAQHITIQEGVILGDGVDLRNRENGRIVLEPYVYLDDGVRLVAARDGAIRIGMGSELGKETIINSGGQTHIGRYCLLAGHVTINASSHGTQRDVFIKEQAHEHGFVHLGDDVWLGANAAIVMNSTIGDGAIVGANSLVSGDIPAFAVCAGVPAKVIRYR